MNYARSWRQEQKRQREAAAIQAAQWILTALGIGMLLALGLIGCGCRQRWVCIADRAVFLYSTDPLTDLKQCREKAR